jgi:hypothetical protein
MFVPILEDEEENELHHHRQDEVVRVEFVEEVMGVVVIKISYVLLLLSIGVAAFVQFCTLDPRYLNDLMWGGEEGNQPYELSSGENFDWNQVQRDEELTRQASKSQRTWQAIITVLLLTFLRAVVFPDLYRNQYNATTSNFEAVLADLLFHIKCRLGIGFLTCVTPLPFEYIETTVVCLSVAIQIASMAI